VREDGREGKGLGGGRRRRAEFLVDMLDEIGGVDGESCRAGSLEVTGSVFVICSKSGSAGVGGTNGVRLSDPLIIRALFYTACAPPRDPRGGTRYRPGHGCSWPRPVHPPPAGTTAALHHAAAAPPRGPSVATR